MEGGLFPGANYVFSFLCVWKEMFELLQGAFPKMATFLHYFTMIGLIEKFPDILNSWK
jgi:hypothetical protein